MMSVIKCCLKNLILDLKTRSAIKNNIPQNVINKGITNPIGAVCPPRPYLSIDTIVSTRTEM